MYSWRRRLAAVAAVTGALAVAAPIAGAGAATTPGAWGGFSFPAFSFPAFSLPASYSIPAYYVDFSVPIGATVSAKGPTVVDSVFNGATVVIVTSGPASSSVIG
jgi:hypothetical protein